MSVLYDWKREAKECQPMTRGQARGLLVLAGIAVFELAVIIVNVVLPTGVLSWL